MLDKAFQYALRVTHTTALSSLTTRWATLSRAQSPTAGYMVPTSTPILLKREDAAPRVAIPTPPHTPHCTLVQTDPAACHACPSRSRPALAAA